MSGRTARCRLVEGCLAATLLSHSSWFPLGFVRVGDYASERLGIGARLLEEEARVSLRLRRLPRVTAAFLDGTIRWTAVRLLVGVATDRDEDRWIAQALALDTRALSQAVKAAAAVAERAGDAATGIAMARGDGAGNAAVVARDAASALACLRNEDDEDGADPCQRWTVRVAPRVRRLWRAACEMASRTAGVRLTPAQVLEQVAAEASSSAPPRAMGSPRAAVAAGTRDRDGDRLRASEIRDADELRAARDRDGDGLRASEIRDADEPPAPEDRDAGGPRASGNRDGDISRGPHIAECAAGADARSRTGDTAASPSHDDSTPASSNPRPPLGLAELLEAQRERTAGLPGAGPLPFLTIDDARELEERDPELAAFYASGLRGDDSDGSRDGSSRDDSLPPPSPPEEGWFEKALRQIGHAEGFDWLKSLPARQPETSLEWLEAEMQAIEGADPHILDARLREVRRAAQAVDFELAALLGEAADRRLHRAFGLRSFESYVEDRLGLRPRTAWSLLSIGRAVRRCCPLLGEAWKSGRISTLAARILLPVLEDRKGDAGGGDADTEGQWIARASTVTLRRLEAEVSWALDRRDAAASPANDGLPMRAPCEEAGVSASGYGLPMRAPCEEAGQAGIAANAHGLPMRAPCEGPQASTVTARVAPPPLDLPLGGLTLAAISPRELQMRAHGDAPPPVAGSGEHAGVLVTVFAPESVIRLVEDTLESLRRDGESRGCAFERMLAVALLEWTAAPRHRDPVFERDGWACAVPGCRSRRNLHDHHVVFRSHGGDNARDNRITVCAAHHLHGLHRGRIQARGLAPHAMEWELGIRFGYGNVGRPLARFVGDRYLGDLDDA